MADTQRTRAALLALFADNVTGQISEQDLRDFQVTVMEQEFANPGDFWRMPQSEFTTTDKWGRGDFYYSQIMGSACSWMNIVALNASGVWVRANCANSLLNGLLGVAMDSYASNYSQAQIMMRGMLYDSAFSGTFSTLFGRPVYLDSGVPGSITLGMIAASNGSAISNFVTVLGMIVVPSTASTQSGGGKWYFNPSWHITGV